MKKELETRLFYIGIVFLAAGIGFGALYYYVLRKWLPEVPCFLLSVAGMYCPGCGGTRAVVALLHGQFLLSLWYHPLILYGVVIGGGFMVTQGLHRIGVKCICGWKFHPWYLYGALVLVICNFFIKNVLWLVWGVTL